MVEQIIMWSGSMPANGMAVESIRPAVGLPFSEQVDSCISQLSEFTGPDAGARYFISQQTFFISASSRAEYEKRASMIREKLSQKCKSDIPATCIVAQSPAPGSEVVLELICTRASEGKRVIYKKWGVHPYTVISYGDLKVVHATGMMGDPEDSIREAAEKAFESVLGILREEGLSLDHIVRQWNYVEDIVQLKDPENTSQNYQVFNDVRARYYDRADFKEGYPAATGIGMDTAGVIIGLIAVSDLQDVEVKALRNPRQIDAHRYSEEMLVGKETGIMGGKCTPKFERAKMLSIGGKTTVYVSGTASIVGEESLHPGEVGKQTHTTIDNIFELFSRENQEALGLDFNVEEVHFSHLRVYVKHRNDIPEVQQICNSRLNCKSSLFLESDICREELLVEIEGIFTLS